jgi:glucose uptake protein GlcU
MRNATTYYALIGIGVIALIVGIYLLSSGHHMSAYAGIAVGVILIVVGVAAMFVVGRR